MTRKVKISDVASWAGVSTATVDRVLHGRGGYSASAAEKVAAAVRELGYGRLAEHMMEPRKRALRVTLLLPALPNHFVQGIADAAQDLRSLFQGTEIILTISHVHLIDGKDTIRALRGVDPVQTDAVCLFAVDAPGVREAIDRLIDAGVKVCTIVSDVPASRRSAYVGLDNVAAGRTAGRMISHFLRDSNGSVGVVTGSNLMRDHIERYMGLSQAVGARRPGLTLLPAKECHSIDERARAVVMNMVETTPDLVAVYSIAGGTRGVIDGLRASGRGSDIVTVVHELDPNVRDALFDGTVDLVLHQSPTEMMRRAFGAIISAVDEKLPDPRGLVAEIFIAENLP